MIMSPPSSEVSGFTTEQKLVMNINIMFSSNLLEYCFETLGVLSA
jgi:hypothetical protein